MFNTTSLIKVQTKRERERERESESVILYTLVFTSPLYDLDLVVNN